MSPYKSPWGGKIIFQDFENGDDANDGLTPETAVLTPARAVELADSGQPQNYVLSLLNGTWVGRLESEDD